MILHVNGNESESESWNVVEKGNENERPSRKEVMSIVSFSVALAVPSYVFSPPDPSRSPSPSPSPSLYHRRELKYDGGDELGKGVRAAESDKCCAADGPRRSRAQE